MPPILPQQQQHILLSALDFVSSRLADRLRPLVSSSSLGDVYEILTAAVYLTSSASNSLYVGRAARAESFDRVDWQLSSRTQTIEEMVESGFYSLGDADHVKCFFCDLGLKDWDAGDEPEMEHAKFSPLCFFLKSSRGLHWLRGACARPPNFPASYTRQDHSQLLSILCQHFADSGADIACKLGFSDTKVLLCVARKFIRFRKKFSRAELLLELQKEADREMGVDPADPPQFSRDCDLASVLREFQKFLSIRLPHQLP